MSCLDVVNNLVDAVSIINTEMTDNMTKEDIIYDDVCIRPDASFDFFYTSLKSKWEKIINDYIDRPEKCGSSLQGILMMYEVLSKMNTASSSTSLSTTTKINDIVNRVGSMTPQQIETIAYEKAIDAALDIIKGRSENKFILEKTMGITLKNLAVALGENCQCQMIDIFTYIMTKYKGKYAKKLEGKNREESIAIMKQDYDYIKAIVTNLQNHLKLMKII